MIETNVYSEKFNTLMKIEGFDNIENFLRHCMFGDDCGCPGICMNEACDYTTPVEPDCCNGWCEECQTTTVYGAEELALHFIA